MENLNQFALVCIAKKNKKIELVLPLTIELQFFETDSLNFVAYWDSTIADNPQSIPKDVGFKVRIMCNHAGEKRSLMERIGSIK